MTASSPRFKLYALTAAIVTRDYWRQIVEIDLALMIGGIIWGFNLFSCNPS